MDIGVAFSLYSWLDESSHSLALFAAWLRVAYTILELCATSSLIIALVCWHRNDATGMHSAMFHFEIGWNAVALGVFGLHLVFLGLGGSVSRPSRARRAAVKRRPRPRACFLLYRVGEGAWASGGVYLPAGEVVLMLWLLVKYARGDVRDGRQALA